MYPSIFNLLPVIWSVRSNVRHFTDFSTFLLILASPGYAPVTIAINVTWMWREFNACQTHGSIVSIYLQQFTSYIEILIGNFSYPLHLSPPLGCSHWNSGGNFGPRKTRIMVLPGSEHQFDDRLSSFDTIPACDGRTDGHTIRWTIAITCVSLLTHVKK